MTNASALQLTSTPIALSADDPPLHTDMILIPTVPLPQEMFRLRMISLLILRWSSCTINVYAQGSMRFIRLFARICTVFDCPSIGNRRPVCQALASLRGETISFVAAAARRSHIVAPRRQHALSTWETRSPPHTESFRSRFPILLHHPRSEPLSAGETARKTPSFPGVCAVHSGLRERNDRPNLSPKGHFSPRPGAMGVSGPSSNSLKLLNFPMLIRTVNSHFDWVGDGNWQRTGQSSKCARTPTHAAHSADSASACCRTFCTAASCRSGG